MLLAANKRLNTAYLLKESFGQLWDYEREGWARRLQRDSTVVRVEPAPWGSVALPAEAEAAR